MYSQGAAILRADLRGVQEEAFLWSEGLIGAKVCPPLPVMARAGQYPRIQIDAGNLLRNETKGRGPSASYPRIQRAITTDTYTCQEYGLEEPVDDSERNDYSRFFDMEAQAVKNVMRQVKLAHELRVATLAFDRATWVATTAATAYTAANIASFDIGLDVDVVKQAIAGRGESTSDLSVVMSLPIFNLARASTRLQNRIRGTISTDVLLNLSAEAMASALDVKEVLIGRNFYDTTAQGITSSLSQIWSNANIWIGKLQPFSGAESYFSGGAMGTLFWQQDGEIFQTETYREEQVRSEVVRCRQYTAEKVINVNAGQILATGG